MKAKEYLSQLQRLDTIVNQKIQERADLRAQLTSISSPDLSKDRVKGGKLPGESGFADRIVKLLSLEEEIDRDTDAFIDLKHKIIGQIHNLHNAEQMKVLYKRYVEFERFEQIAVDLHYSIRNIYKIHGYALKEFQNENLQECI